MYENVGRADQAFRVGLGSLLAYAGLRMLDKRRLAPAALLTTGALILSSAVTRVCPVNRLLGIDTRSRRAREKTRLRAQRLARETNEDIGGVQRPPADS